MKRIFSILLIVVFAAVSSYEVLALNPNAGLSNDDEVVKTGIGGAQFLKIGVGARASAMGGAYSSIANDVTAMYWNPACIIDIKGISASMAYSNWIANYKHNYAGLTMPIARNLVIGFNMISFGVNRVEVTYLEDQNTDTYYDINDLSLAASVATLLTEQFSLGFTVRYNRNAFANLSAGGVAFDFGTLYNTGILNDMKLSFTIQNLGPQMEYTGTDLYTSKKNQQNLTISAQQATYLTDPFALPLTFRAGLSSVAYKEEEMQLLLSGDFITVSDSKEQFCFGGEFSYGFLDQYNLCARMGYMINHDQLGFSGGVGFGYDMGALIGKLDYAFVPTKDFGVISKLTASIDLR